MYREVGGSLSLEMFRKLSVLSLGTWFSAVLGSARLMVRLDDPGAHFQLKSSYEFFFNF